MFIQTKLPKNTRSRGRKETPRYPERGTESARGIYWPESLSAVVVHAAPRDAFLQVMVGWRKDENVGDVAKRFQAHEIAVGPLVGGTTDGVLHCEVITRVAAHGGQIEEDRGLLRVARV